MAVIDRRIGLLFGGFIVLLAIAVGRAGYLGVFRSNSLKAAAASQQVSKDVIPAVRGEITDRSGQLLALSESADNIYADPLLIAKDQTAVKGQTPQQLADELAPLTGLPATTLLQRLTKTTRDGTLAGYSPLALNVPASAGGQIANMRINGLWETPLQRRVYPRDDELAQVLGFVNASGNGGGGLEYLFNKTLHGKSGVQTIVNDAQGQAISVATTKPMVPGKNLSLTISAPLQSEVEAVLAQVGAEYSPLGATAIVTDPQTDQVLALANWPFTNANSGGNASAAASEDQAVDMSYEPGSTFKAITVAGALQDGIVTPDTVIGVPSQLDPYGRLITDAESHGNEALTVAQILKVSSNIGADEIGLRMGADNFAGWVTKFGFGQPTGVQLPGEQQGVILPVSKYSGVSMYNLPFGQGQEVTPMQMVQAYDAIANGGVLRSPQIVKSIGGKPDPMPKGTQVISPTVASELRNMLRGVLADGGTASGAAISGYDLAGKTGTAQVAINGKYSSSKFVASFIGMVPASNPKLVVAVVVNQPVGTYYGGSVAAPAFQKIVGWAVPYFGINPCPAPCPVTAYQSATPSTP